MAALKQYLPTLLVYIDGVSQVELQDVTVTVDSKKIPVELKNGLAGFASGPKSLTLEFKSATPVYGPEFDTFLAAHGNVNYTIQVPIGGKTIVSEGQFTTASITSAVGSATDVSGSFLGTYNEPK